MGIPIKTIGTPKSGQAWDPEPGDLVRGKIVLAKIMPPKPNFDGDKLEQELRIDLVTQNLGPDGEPQKVTIWAVIDNDVEGPEYGRGEGYPGRLARAIVDAVSEAGSDDLEEGAELAVARIEDVPPTQKGRKPAKNYRAQYTPPPKGVAGLVDIVNPTEPPTVPADPFAQPAPQALTSAPFVPATATPIGFQADPFAGLDGGLAAPPHPAILAEHRARASAIFGISEADLAGNTAAADLALMIKERGVPADQAETMLATLYGRADVAQTAVATAYAAQAPAPAVDPLQALLGG